MKRRCCNHRRIIGIVRQYLCHLLPLLFPRVTIYYLQITGKYKPLTPPQEPVDIAVEDDPAPAEESAVQPRDEGGEQE